MSGRPARWVSGADQSTCRGSSASEVRICETSWEPIGARARRHPRGIPSGAAFCGMRFHDASGPAVESNTCPAACDTPRTWHLAGMPMPGGGSPAAIASGRVPDAGIPPFATRSCPRHAMCTRASARLGSTLDKRTAPEDFLVRCAYSPEALQGDGAQPMSGLNHPVIGDMPILWPTALVEMTVPLPRLMVTWPEVLVW